MGDSDPSHIEGHMQEQILSRDNDGLLCPILPKHLPDPERRKSLTRDALSRSRTSNACEGCRKRKTKCSGSPGPCRTCRGLETTCIFRPKSRRRDKHPHRSDDYPEKQKYILHGVFLILKHNTTQDIQQLIQLIRNNVQPEEIFDCIRVNLRLLQERALIEEREIDDRNFFALAPPTLLQGRKHPKVDFGEELDEGTLSKAGSWSTELEFDGLANQTVEATLPSKEAIIFPTYSEVWQTLPGTSPTYNNADEFLEAIGFGDH